MTSQEPVSAKDEQTFPSMDDRSAVMNALTVIIGTSQSIRRSSAKGYPLRLSARTVRIEHAARSIVDLFDQQLARRSADAPARRREG